MKSLLSIFLILLTSSCTFLTDNIFGNFPDANNFLQRFPENEKVLVILKNNVEDLFWCKVESENHNIKLEDYCLRVRANKLNQVIMFDPGIYKLMDYNFTKEQYIFGKTKKNLSSKLSLTINATSGNLLYVGLIERVGSKYKAESEFVSLQKAFKSKNYQELKASFQLSLQEIEWLVKLYEKNPNILKEKISEVAKYEEQTKSKNKNISCVPVCNYDFVEKKEQELKLNRDKYNQKYINKLEKELSFEKEKCRQVSKGGMIVNNDVSEDD